MEKGICDILVRGKHQSWSIIITIGGGDTQQGDSIMTQPERFDFLKYMYYLLQIRFPSYMKDVVI